MECPSCQEACSLIALGSISRSSSYLLSDLLNLDSPTVIQPASCGSHLFLGPPPKITHGPLPRPPSCEFHSPTRTGCLGLGDRLPQGWELTHGTGKTLFHLFFFSFSYASSPRLKFESSFGCLDFISK